MENTKSTEMDSQFWGTWEDILSTRRFLTFDTFLISEMGFGEATDEAGERIRQQAFRKFRKLTGHFAFASLPTIRKWFGIGGIAKPSRELVYGICLELQTGRKKAEEYLTIGLGEEGFRYSDYREMIYLYGLEQKLTFEQCRELVERYESNWCRERLPDVHREYLQLKSKFEEIKLLEPSAFLNWMVTNQNWFKGYSQRTMDILQQCKKEVLSFIRKEAKERLDSLLSETDFKEWRSKKNYEELNQREVLKRYIRTHQEGQYYKISQNMCDNILELSQIVYSELEANSKLLAEVFSTSGKRSGTRKRKGFRNIHNVTSKHLSDLFNIPMQKEREMYVRLAYQSLAHIENESVCPDWIPDLLRSSTKSKIEFHNVEEARTWLKRYSSEQKRRCLHVQRNDILPMAHYIAQHRYLEEITDKNLAYNARDAKACFVELANQLLCSCRMAPLSADYELDAILLLCFQPEEMYSFSEILDMAEERA